MIKADISIQWDKTASHPLQSWAWGEFRTSMGIDVVRINGWQLTFHKIPHTPFTIGYFPKGPIPTKEMVNELTKLGKQKKAIFIQLEPNVIHDSRFTIDDLRLKPSHHPLFTKFTFILDLRTSEDELLKSMTQKTRYNIKVAQKHGVSIQEDSSDAAFNQYLRLNAETTSRQGFYAHNKTYHQHMWDIMSKAGIAHLFTATYQGETLAAWILFVWKDTLYYPYGASSRLHREVMAPNLLLWEVVKWAKKQNLSYFDLWGAIGGTPDPKDPWYGFHRFKEGYHPNLVEYVGSYDLVIRPLLYQCYKLLDRARIFLLKKQST
jgi:lipid II:glycine glycyltransferase (peptidoglycan interpeptide bridge formation enzyme)